MTPHGFPRVAGDYRGFSFDLQAVPDTLTFRKLPALWLLATLTRPMPVLATVDMMRNATGGEVFSKFSLLPVQIVPPKHYPGRSVGAHRCARRDARRFAGEPVSRSFRYAAGKGAGDRAAGLRIVRLAEEANRNRYLIFRDAEMGSAPLNPEAVLPLWTGWPIWRPNWRGTGPSPRRKCDMSKPVDPRLVLAAATVLPGTGQVLNGQPVRDLSSCFSSFFWEASRSRRPHPMSRSSASWPGAFSSGRWR
jgi:hypothetical protein